MFYCKFCQSEFKTKQELGGHTTVCSKNPNYLRNLKILENGRNSNFINHVDLNFKCPFCKKEFHNHGAFAYHEKTCYLNPLAEKKLKVKKEKKEFKEKKKRIVTEEHKEKLKKGLIKWREEHKEEFLRYSRGQSTVCENFKKMLREQNIDFIEEFTPYPEERLYRLDIAFPDEKIGIEINGSQHYNKNGDLNHATLEKQKFFEEHGWKIFQIHYRKCFSIKIEEFQDILSLPIHDKEYVKEDFDFLRKFKEKKKKEKEEKHQKILNKIKEEKEQREENYKNIIISLIESSNIDFSKFGWVDKAKTYIQEKYGYCPKMLKRTISKYYPEFFEIVNPFTRKRKSI